MSRPKLLRASKNCLPIQSGCATTDQAILQASSYALEKKAHRRGAQSCGTGWPAPGLDDTQLSKSGLPLELHRAQITDRRVSAFRVIEALDIVKHVCLCLIARPVRFVTGALGLQRREEALHRGVVPHVA